MLWGIGLLGMYFLMAWMLNSSHNMMEGAVGYLIFYSSYVVFFMDSSCYLMSMCILRFKTRNALMEKLMKEQSKIALVYTLGMTNVALLVNAHNGYASSLESTLYFISVNFLNLFILNGIYFGGKLYDSKRVAHAWVIALIAISGGFGMAYMGTNPVFLSINFIYIGFGTYSIYVYLTYIILLALLILLNMKLQRRDMVT